MGSTQEKLKVIISGGGTGGHIFPALAIAEALKKKVSDIEFLFVGAEGKMEMTKVPKAGYKIIGLPIRGFSRKINFKGIIHNIETLLSLGRSMLKAKKIVTSFKPDFAIGVGGYASGPMLKASVRKNVPIFLQEQNSFAGLTNKLLAKETQKICVAYDGMEKFFPKSKIIKTGNPVRESICNINISKKEGLEILKFDTHKPLVLLMGGSGGARTLNEAMKNALELIKKNENIQWLWQCGAYYLNEYKNCEVAQLDNVTITAFIENMSAAYVASDIVIARAGALTISELCVLGKPSILVPSPNVAEDHQTHNAMALVNNDAALIVTDVDAKTNLVVKAIELIENKKEAKKLAANITRMASYAAADQIADVILEASGVTIDKNEDFFSGIQSVFMIGIGGIGMSAIARYLKNRGIDVMGYDKTQTKLTNQLEKENIKIIFDENIELIPNLIDLVIYTPAIPDGQLQLTHFKNCTSIPVLKRAEALGKISKEKKTYAIAGTHGKTSTSTLLSHLLIAGNKDISAILGGIVSDWGSNFKHGESNVLVVEADEYDKSFLHLKPNAASILSVDADHLDIYGDRKLMLAEGFGAFINKIETGGTLLIPFEARKLEIFNRKDINILTFGIEEGDIQAKNVRVENGTFVFDFYANELEVKNFKTHFVGKHNVLNAINAIYLSMLEGVNAEDLKKGLSEFKGIKRRFEIIKEVENKIYIDDYAHHPTEIKAAWQTVNELYPNRKKLVVFQPHLFSRTKDFATEFAEVLDDMEQLILVDIYPARELPFDGITSQIIIDKMTKNNKIKPVALENVLDEIKKYNYEVILTLGAGNIDTLIDKIADTLEK